MSNNEATQTTVETVEEPQTTTEPKKRGRKKGTSTKTKGTSTKTSAQKKRLEQLKKEFAAQQKKQFQQSLINTITFTLTPSNWYAVIVLVRKLYDAGKLPRKDFINLHDKSHKIETLKRKYEDTAWGFISYFTEIITKSVFEANLSQEEKQLFIENLLDEIAVSPQTYEEYMEFKKQQEKLAKIQQAAEEMKKAEQAVKPEEGLPNITNGTEVFKPQAAEQTNAE